MGDDSVTNCQNGCCCEKRLSRNILEFVDIDAHHYVCSFNQIESYCHQRLTFDEIILKG